MSTLTTDQIVRAFMDDFAERCDQDYDSLMAAAAKWIETSDYTLDNSERYKDGLTDEMWDTFWVYYQYLTGVALPERARDHFFTCSC